MKRIAVLLALSFALFCLPARAEEIQLKDGTKITGKLIAINGDTFQVKTAYGEIQVPRSEVLSITFPENQPKKEGESAQAAIPVDESLQGTIYINRTAHFQVTVPSTWEIASELRKGNKEIIAALKSSDETLFFLVTPEKFDGTLSAYKAICESLYQTKIKDYEKVSESEAHLDAKTGIRLVLHGKSPQAGDALVKFLVYIVPYEGRMVRLTLFTLEPLFSDNLATFEAIAASYHTLTP
jgi:hypothetical protein